MKFVVAVCVLATVSAAAAQAATAAATTATAATAPAAGAGTYVVKHEYVRDLPADILRDFPGKCFASSLCRVFDVDATWPLGRFCGRATCLQINNTFVERVEDCGPRLVPHESCEYDPGQDAPYPACCEKQRCPIGVAPRRMTDAELKAEDQRLRQEFEAAVAAQQQQQQQGAGGFGAPQPAVF